MYNRIARNNVEKTSELADKIFNLFQNDESTFYNDDVDAVCNFSLTSEELSQTKNYAEKK